MCRLEGHTGFVRSVAFCGKQIVSGSEDKTIRVWDAITGGQESGRSYTLTSSSSLHIL